jgi:hypothetical protein
MALKGSGSGSPMTFQCWNCRRCKSGYRFTEAGYWVFNECGRVSDVILTGKSRSRPFARGVRHEATLLEYKCNDCGHRGWSSHGDLLAKGTTA